MFKRRRRRPDVPSATHAGVKLSIDVALVLRDSEPAYRRILREYEERGTSEDLRAAALQLARKISAYQRLALISGEDVLSVPEEYSPNKGLSMLQHMSYALVALGQEQPDAGTLISGAELDERIDAAGAREWLDRVLESVPDDWEAP